MRIIESFFEYNKEQSAQFIDPDNTLSRRQYRAMYPAGIAVLKCMDGRLNFSVLTNTPPGIIQPYRNLGGKFEVGGHFGELLAEWINRTARVEGRDAIILVTYHWSAGLKERGCKGFHGDVEAGRKYTRKLLEDIETIFGKSHKVVYPIQVGIETDQDALVLHGAGGKSFDLSEATSDTPDYIRGKLESLFPDMKPVLIESLIPLCVGNIRHMAETRESGRTESDIEHKENILGVGRGFDDWFHLPNRMLIVGPYNFDLAAPIVVAGRILLENLKEKRIPANEGVALIASAVFRDDAGPERIRAMYKARLLADFAFESLKREKELEELIPHVDMAAGILNQNTRLFTRIEL